jgi:hypothetical protein
LHFDDATKTCNIIVAVNGENPPAGDEDGLHARYRS